MKIALLVGHSILKNGNITSANGIINEYKYCKGIAPLVAKYLKELGADVTTIICPEKKFVGSIEERKYKLDIINKGNFDLVVELHLNAFAQESANGTEVYYKSEKGKVFADRVQAKMSTLFRDRGVQKKDNLYILNSTYSPAILLELFFCTNKSDVNKSKDTDKIARLIAEGIMNKDIKDKYVPAKAVTPDSNVKDIKWLQEHLNINLKGQYQIKVTGKYDSPTRIAVLMHWHKVGKNKKMTNDGTKAGKPTIDMLAKEKDVLLFNAY